MKIKLDDSTQDAINANYKIDPSVFREIEQRRQSSEAATNSIKNTLQDAPTKPELPEQSSSVSSQIVNNTNYDIKLKNAQLKTVLNLLSLLDVSIDKVDEIIIKLDLKALLLIDEINTAIKKLEQAHSAIITSGCKSNLIWSLVGKTSWIDEITLGIKVANTYKVVKDPDQRRPLEYYGIKYYQKPSNRDYGFNIISEFNGMISVGSRTLAVLGVGKTVGIQIGDEITDNLSAPEVFNIDNLPTVVGFGTTSILGITTTIGGNVALGSNIIEYTGIGLTGNISIGDLVVNIDAFDSDTKVVGFGTTTSIITYNNVGLSTFISTNIVVPSIILNKVSIGLITNGYFGFGYYNQYETIKLSSSSNLAVENQFFTAIRKTEDVTTNFNYTNNPIDPITIGIINTQRVGIGHKAQLIRNESNPGPAQWRQVLGNKEPNIGAGSLYYYTGYVGQQLWPCINTTDTVTYTTISTYATEGTICNFEGVADPSYTTISPTGISGDSSTCSNIESNIIEETNNLQKIINKNVPQIEKLISASTPLRNNRDGDESKAWSYLQSASYLRSEINILKTNIDTLNSFDYNSL